MITVRSGTIVQCECSDISPDMYPDLATCYRMVSL